MKTSICLLIGYLLGALNPALLISKLKHKNLRENGTGNLGAVNTMLVFGKKTGAIVMLADIAKAFGAVWCARWIAPEIRWLSLAAGVSAVVGHCFPFYLRGKGGKGLAAYGGMILALDPLLFLILLAIALAAMFLVNYSVAMPISAGILFPILWAVRSGDVLQTVLAIAVSLLVIGKHFSNIGKARRGEDIKIREYVKDELLHRP